MRVIAVSSQKGGTGKTTTAATIAAGAVKNGQKALLIDLDPQGSLTLITRTDGNLAGSYDVLKGTPIKQVIQRREGWPDTVAASLMLAGADAELYTKPGRDFILKKALEPVKDEYDLIVIDTAPALGTLLVNSLSAATEVVIPVQADTFAMQSIYQLMETISQVRQYCNENLTVSGVLITRYGRAILSRDITEGIQEQCAAMGIPVFKTQIREGVAVKEAQMVQKDLFEYAPKSNPAKDYMKLLQELKIVDVEG
jgi:chromosome partitioning protein